MDVICNLSKGVCEEGIEKATVDHIISLMKNTEWDIETCMDKLNIPSEKKKISLYRLRWYGRKSGSEEFRRGVGRD